MARSARRCFLFVPGDDERKIEKAAGLAVDAVIFDLEDAVAPSRKEDARRATRAALERLPYAAEERVVRINPVSTSLADDDLDAIVPARPDAVFLPKVESAEEVRAVSTRLLEAERANGWEERSIRLLALIESARGVIEAAAIAAADERLDALAFGAEDFTSDIGAIRTTEGAEIATAHGTVVLAAAAYGRQAIDTPFVDLHDMQGLEAATAHARNLGYSGKLAIHPRQVSVIEGVFTPDAETVAEARALIEAFEAHEERGSGVFAHLGKMVDMPMVRAARKVLERAQAAERREDAL